MKQHTLNAKTLLSVPVPEDAINFAFGFDTPNWLYYYLKSYTNSFDHRHIVLPPGSYTILGRGRDLTEEQWKNLVEYRYEYGNSKSKGILICKDYVDGKTFDNFTQSGHSFLKSEGISPDDLLLLKQ